MANPPLYPSSFTPTADGNPVTHGTIISYGLEDLTVVGILIDSYKRDAKYAKVDEVVGQDGLVQGVRMSDYRVELSISGRVLEDTAYAGKVGDIFTATGTADKGVITQVSMSASGTGFTTLDLSVTCYENVAGIEPA